MDGSNVGGHMVGHMHRMNRLYLLYRGYIQILVYTGYIQVQLLYRFKFVKRLKYKSAILFLSALWGPLSIKKVISVVSMGNGSDSRVGIVIKSYACDYGKAWPFWLFAFRSCCLQGLCQRNYFFLFISLFEMRKNKFGGNYLLGTII